IATIATTRSAGATNSHANRSRALAHSLTGAVSLRRPLAGAVVDALTPKRSLAIASPSLVGGTGAGGGTAPPPGLLTPYHPQARNPGCLGVQLVHDGLELVRAGLEFGGGVAGSGQDVVDMREV